MTVRRSYVWDIPTRLFHWSLVGLIAFSWYSAKTDHMEWHRYSGITVAGLIIFRLLWGFFGTSTSRFTQFVKGPRAMGRYFRPEPGIRSVPALGHNPVGGWSVVALLCALLVQVTAGLFAVDVDGIESGPLSRFVSFDRGRLASHVHGISFNVLLGLIGLHIAAILFYLLVKRNNLIGPMVTGWKQSEAAEGAATVSIWRFASTVGVATLLAWWIYKGFAL